MRDGLASLQPTRMDKSKDNVDIKTGEEEVYIALGSCVFYVFFFPFPL